MRKKQQLMPKVIKQILENECPVRVELEYEFHDKRKWRIDIAVWSNLDDTKIAIEIEGGIWQSGRHNRASGFLKDIEKYNELTMHGFMLLRFTHTNHDHNDIFKSIKYLIGNNNA